MSNPDLWGTPPPRRQVRGTYAACDFAPVGQFGPREAGSTFAGTLQVQAIIMPAAAAIEMMADSYMPRLAPGVAFGGAVVTQTLMFVLLKVLGSILRNYGASLARDFGAWLWCQITDCLPGGHRRKRRRERDDEPDVPDRPRRRPLIDWFFPRQRRR